MLGGVEVFRLHRVIGFAADSVPLKMTVFWMMTKSGQGTCSPRLCAKSTGRVQNLVNCQTLGYTRRRSEGKRWRKRYVSLILVCSHWANLGCYREVGDARAHNDGLDDRARHHRIDPGRRR